MINTIVDKGPIIFLKLAESTRGEYDGIILPNTYGGDYGLDSTSDYENYSGTFIDYTRVMNITKSKYNLAPRK